MSHIGLQVAPRFHLPVDCSERVLPLDPWPPAHAPDALSGESEDREVHTVATIVFRLFCVPVHLEHRWFELLSAHPGGLPRPEELDGYATELAAFLQFKTLPRATAQEDLALTLSVTADAPGPRPAAAHEAGPAGCGAWGIINLGTDAAALRVGLDAGDPQPGGRAIVLNPREGVTFPVHHALALDGLWPLSGEPAVSVWLS